MLLVLHPAWTISASKGDCGATKAEAALVVSGAAALAILVQAMLRAGLAVRRRRAAARHGPNETRKRESD
ncbi:hypothetical protein AB1L88_24180 [Tautonia sp. JC769]|uniref:hypothetical protein n=1 Tax=Tautonia sp. JC769 TaxID=3232135 RepID=UPI0034598889